MAQTLLDSYDKLTDTQRKVATEIILKSSSRLESFDANIASLSKLDSGDYIINKETIDFTNLVYSRTGFCRKLYEENKEDREFILDIEENLTIQGDRYYLTQVLDNLIINALTYCKEGKVAINLYQSRDKIYFSISDEGIGIPTNELLDIFQEFTVSSRTYTSAGGRGVGLAVCKSIIAVHGGKIKAESNGEKGATFQFDLPK